MTCNIRLAGSEDLELLLDLMGEFYVVEDMKFDVEVARRALGEILAHPSQGRLWIMESEGDTAGYLVLTFGFSLEYRGRDAFVDELYLRPAFRGRGFGGLAMELAERTCREERIQALHLEVDRKNAPARALYARSGFIDKDRLLLTKWLS